MQEQWLLAFDLDGTLFNTDHQISARTLNTLNNVVELGHQIVILTGRSWHSAVPRLHALPAKTQIVCSNGSYSYDREKQQFRWAEYLSASTSIAVRQRILDKLPMASFGWEAAGGLTYEEKFIVEAGGAHTLEQGGNAESIGKTDLFKLFARTPEQHGGELVDSLRAFLGGEVEIASSGAPFAEITAAGVNKGSALAKVATQLGFKADRAMAFGDNLNDIAMLQWAGESVAMGNAVAELKAIATLQAPGNSDDGVAHVLENKFNA